MIPPNAVLRRLLVRVEELRIPALGERDHLVELERCLAEFELLPDREIVEGAHSLTVHGRRDAVAPDGRVALCSAATTRTRRPVTDAVISELAGGIEADLEEFTVPGASWALIEGGRIVHEGGLGLAAADRDDPVTPATLFQACSISKPVAAFAMLRLVDRGLLDLDEDVNDRLTSWRVPPTRSWQPVVTLRQLVSHSAGLTTSGFPGYRAGEALPTTVAGARRRRRRRTPSACGSTPFPGSSSATRAVGRW